MDVIYYILFLLLFLIICSIFFKSIEGFDDKFYYDKLIDYKTIPNSYVNDSTPSRTINKFGFYKGEGIFKKGFSAETKSDEKISILNKLLNRLLGRIVSDNQDCVGDFGKYSECDKSCGSNSYQTRTYNVSQERGQNGLDCAFEDGYKEKKRCGVDECQLGDICENNADCGTGNCGVNSTRCENMVPCDTKNVHVCDEDDCIKLNDDDGNNDDVKMLDGVYIYNNVDKECFFKTPAEIEELNLNIYTYDYRTISEQVKNLVLDCKYYQVKKDGVGPCINAPNITMEGEEAKCKPGFGPKPTMFNGSHACTKCLIKNDGGEYKNAEVCACELGTRLSDDICEPDEGLRGNVCLLPTSVDAVPNSVKFWNGAVDAEGEQVCSPCPEDKAFKKEGSNISCIPCESGHRTLSSNCLGGTTADPCLIKTELIERNLTDLAGNPIEDVNSAPSYQEQCVITVGDDGLPLGMTPENYNRCPAGVSECCPQGVSGCDPDIGPYVCERGYQGDRCQNHCVDNQDECAESGEVCLEGDADNRLVCLLPEGGKYIDEDGLVQGCTPQEGCGDAVAANECVEGTSWLQCNEADTYGNTPAFVAENGLVTNCTEYGDFFPKVGADCIGACYNEATNGHAASVFPGNVATEWKYKSGKETEGVSNGCPANATPGGSTSCSPAGSSDNYVKCGICGGRNNIENLLDDAVRSVPLGNPELLPEGLREKQISVYDTNYLAALPASPDDDLRWNSQCVNPNGLRTHMTYSRFLKQGTEGWQYDYTKHAWNRG